MGSDRDHCEHPRLARLDVEDELSLLFGNVYKCDVCGALVEVVVGRTITTAALREFADAVDSGRAKPSLTPEPSNDVDDNPDIVEVDDVWEEPKS